ncbi:unnamed protein product [Linum tenue]|uniref:non-specific serine/threonine protein kinase n=1 Tax=Linum tenue TaxID=586396 RepID=A0AAV0IJ44_9ROSI|nr:unnamed protein product [Linum tenue]
MESQGQRGSGSNRRVGRYELGKTLGEGAFSKVKLARNTETGETVAIKILDKGRLLKYKMIAQIKREISTMKQIRHPNVIRMHELSFSFHHSSKENLSGSWDFLWDLSLLLQVMVSKERIYIVMEFVAGGELFDKVARGRLKEAAARRYFQQLINAVDYCHTRGVYHRDLKLENLLLDGSRVLKVADFGLSALPQQLRGDGLLHTMCGTPTYIAPEVISRKGYDGAKADVWSCGVILFVLMAGYMPFHDSNILAMYRKICKADYSCPPCFSTSGKELIKRILDPDPATRISIAEIIENEWFKKDYEPPVFEHADISLDDVDSFFNDSADTRNLVVAPMDPSELITTSRSLNLSSPFQRQMGLDKRETGSASERTASDIMSQIEAAATSLRFHVKKNNLKMTLQGEKTGPKGHLSIAAEIFEVAPSQYTVELRKSGGDALQFHKFYKTISTGLKGVVWRTVDEVKEEGNV